MRIVIIGSGLIGLTTAYALQQQGHEISIIDRQSGPGMETSHANGGMLTPSMADPWNSPGVFLKMLKWLGHEDAPVLLRPCALPSMLGWGMKFLQQSKPRHYHRNTIKNAELGYYNLEVMGEITQQLKLDFDYAQRGSLKIFRDEKAMQHSLEVAQKTVECGVSFEALSAEQVRQKEPALSAIADKLVGGIYFPSDQAGDAYKFCQGLASYLESTACQFSFDTEVSGLRQEKSRLVSVVTNKGAFVGDAYVLAAGSYSPLLVKQLGINLPIRPVKGYSLNLAMQGWQNVPQLPVIDDDLHAAFTPLGKDLRVAGTAEFTGYNLGLTAGRISNLQSITQQVYPEAQERLASGHIEPWTGLRPVSSDGVPIIGATPIKNLFINAGHGHLGWTMAAASGQLLADFISGASAKLNLADYSLARY